MCIMSVTLRRRCKWISCGWHRRLLSIPRDRSDKYLFSTMTMTDHLELSVDVVQILPQVNLAIISNVGHGELSSLSCTETGVYGTAFAVPL